MKTKALKKGGFRPVKIFVPYEKPYEFKIMCIRECAPVSTLTNTPELAAQYWRLNIPNADWFDPAKEAFIVLVLNTRRCIYGHNLVMLGTLDACLVHPREVFRPVIVAAGSAIVIMHNHPSGNPTPSENDIKWTRTLVRAGELLQIPVLDHIIMGDPTYLSLWVLGYFDEKHPPS